MIEIRVRGFLTYRDTIGDQCRFLAEESTSLNDLLSELAFELGGEFRVSVSELVARGARPRLAVLVNGRHYSHLPAGLDTPLNDGDEVAIFPPIAGGIE